jgi:hypothetical protein
MGINKKHGMEALPAVCLFASEKAVFQYAVYGPESVFPADFFSFGIGAPVIRYAYLINSDIFYTGDFGGNFRFKAKTVFA